MVEMAAFFSLSDNSTDKEEEEEECNVVDQ